MSYVQQRVPFHVPLYNKFLACCAMNVNTLVQQGLYVSRQNIHLILRALHALAKYNGAKNNANSFMDTKCDVRCKNNNNDNDNDSSSSNIIEECDIHMGGGSGGGLEIEEGVVHGCAVLNSMQRHQYVRQLYDALPLLRETPHSVFACVALQDVAGAIVALGKLARSKATG
uniref:Uncharacterized protein n=1 Tax=Lygus hesperus TaxID=30085 RepID=A0A0A9YGS2_LYGHE